MNDKDKLKLLLQESQYPYFSDVDLDAYLDIYKDVYLTASKLCLMKASMQKSVKVGPISIEYPESSYWSALSNQYLQEYRNQGASTGGTYINQMKRLDR